MRITKSQAKQIADLAKLELTDAELEKYAGEIGVILDYVSQISKVDVSDIPETSNLKDYQGETLRTDSPVAGMPIQDTIQNATNGRSQANSFKTSKIIGGEEGG